MEELKTTADGESLDLNKTKCLFDSKVTIDDLNDLLRTKFFNPKYEISTFYK